MPLLTIASALWGNQWTRLAAVAILASGFGWVKGWNAYPRVDVAAITRNAEAGRDAVWSRKLAETEEKSRLEIDAAIEAASHASVDGSLDELCRKSASTCRDR
jgi:hypothetical protein